MPTVSQGFKKNEKLCSRKKIETLIAEGSSVYFPLFRIIYLKDPGELPAPAQAAFSVPKKGFRLAVTRNLLKRRMREAYRKNKMLLYDAVVKSGAKLTLIFIYRLSTVASYDDIEKQMILALRRLASELEKQLSHC